MTSWENKQIVSIPFEFSLVRSVKISSVAELLWKYAGYASKKMQLVLSVKIISCGSIPAPGAMFVSLQSFVGCCDPIIYDWLTYTPSQTTKQGPSTLTPDDSEAKVKIIDSSLAQATSPLNVDEATEHGQFYVMECASEGLCSICWHRREKIDNLSENKQTLRFFVVIATLCQSPTYSMS